MRQEKFVERLNQGKSCSLLYKTAEHEGLVNISSYRNQIILTWEECLPGDQYNEHLYSKDERHVFSTIEETLAFLAEVGLKVTDFQP